MRRLLARAVPLALLVCLALAPAAGAYNDGRGFYAGGGDKAVTNAGFILVLFFPTFIFLASRIQAHLEKRKRARKAAAKSQLGNAYLRGGW
jgi:hypothetical protein